MKKMKRDIHNAEKENWKKKFKREKENKGQWEVEKWEKIIRHGNVDGKGIHIKLWSDP